MKKNTLILIVLLVLGAVSVFLVMNKNSGTYSGSLKDFAIEDTAKLDKIFIIEKNGDNVTLTREGGKWFANETVPAQPNLVKLLLETIKSMEVKSPVPESAEQTVLRDMATTAKKVELYTNGKKKKTFYIDGATPDELGTYMLLEGADKPSVVHVPGFYGYLSSRFFTDTNLWRDRTVFGYSPDNISRIKVSYRDFVTKGFELKVHDDKFITLTSAMGDTAAGNVDGNFLRYYLGAFADANLEAYRNGLSEFQVDSVLREGPFATIEVEGRNGETTKANLYQKPLSRRNKVQTDEEGNSLPFDTDRFFIEVNDSKKLWLAQYFVFDKLLAYYSDFFAKESEELKL